MIPNALAVKAMILRNGHVLLIRRSKNDVHKPDSWDIPGGRLDPGENPYDGIQRETREEVGIEVRVHAPIDVQHFTRDDGQVITMIIFLCAPTQTDIQLSEEHTQYKWHPLDSSEQWLTSDDAWLSRVVERLQHTRLHERF